MEHFKQGLSLNEEVTNLIRLRQEGSFWDFKKQWYTNKSDMLHDIICMSNNLSNRTAYIIIGIDEQRDYSIVDVSCDPNRKNTQKLVDFLKDKKFAGGIRPVVHVESLHYSNGVIDTIVIENSSNIVLSFGDTNDERIEEAVLLLIQECLGVLAARCASCNCMTYFYCAPLQSCRRLYQLGD